MLKCDERCEGDEMSSREDDVLWPAWRIKLLRRLDVVLIIFEFILSVIFLSISYLRGSMYLRGVGVGLLIAWVTSAIAYIFKVKAPSGIVE